MYNEIAFYKEHNKTDKIEYILKKAQKINNYNDRELFLFDHLYTTIFRIAYFKIRDEDYATDISSEVIFKLSKELSLEGNYNEQFEKAYAWLKRITINQTIDTWRKITRRKTRELKELSKKYDIYNIIYPIIKEINKNIRYNKNQKNISQLINNIQTIIANAAKEYVEKENLKDFIISAIDDCLKKIDNDILTKIVKMKLEENLNTSKLANRLSISRYKTKQFLNRYLPILKKCLDSKDINLKNIDSL